MIIFVCKKAFDISEISDVEEDNVQKDGFHKMVSRDSRKNEPAVVKNNQKNAKY